MYRDKPDLVKRDGLRRIHVVYGTELWHGMAAAPKEPEEFQATLRRRAQEWEQTPDVPVVFDIELWQVSGDSAVVTATVSKFLRLVKWVREEAPDVKIGFYGIPPLRDYGNAIQGPASPKYQAWQAQNDRFQSLADQVDILYPSLYTFYEDVPAWQTYARANLSEALRMAHGNPQRVVPFIWPRFHNSNKTLGLQFISPAYWQAELETVSQSGTGAVVWDSDSFNTKNGISAPPWWNDSAAWWQITQKFLSACPADAR